MGRTRAGDGEAALVHDATFDREADRRSVVCRAGRSGSQGVRGRRRRLRRRPGRGRRSGGRRAVGFATAPRAEGEDCADENQSYESSDRPPSHGSPLF